ncbi:MAG: hypothetical protein J6S23_01210 [Clostridia bacterium]|nr:hypothetical protein [Clostridia bacterium]
MEYTLQEKYDLIKQHLLNTQSKNPIKIAKELMNKDFINMHGPEHHFLDGAAFLTAYKNAGGDIDLPTCMETLAKRTIMMPGAMCGYWGVCGSVTAVGAALSVIHKTSPLSTDDYYKDNMEYTSAVISKMSKIGGARCCKRNAFISLSNGIKFVKEKYGIEMETETIACDYKLKNSQCIQERCPFYKN